MAIHQEKNKTYTVQVPYRDQNGKLHKKQKRGFVTKREAKKWEFETQQGINKNIYTFNQMANLYYDSIDVTKQTRLHREHYIKDYMSWFNDLDINKITKPMLHDWRSYIRDLSLSTATKNNIIICAKSVFKYAYETYGISNPSSVIKTLRKKPSEIKEMKVWTIDEFNTFISKVKNPVFHAFFRLLFWTGMRRGEALALFKSDVHNDKTITITKSVRQWTDGIGGTKNTSSVRRITVDEDTYQELLKIMDSDGDFLFGGTRTLPLETLRRYWNNAIIESGVKHIRIHDLRHSHASILLNNPNVSIPAVSKRLGHSSVATTMNIYTHVIEKANDKLNAYISDIAKK